MAIGFVSAASANATSVTITTPTLGNIILVFSYNGTSTTVPTLASGYTNLGSKTQTAIAGRAAYKISAGNETTSGTWTNASHVVCMVYSGVHLPGTLGDNGGSSASLSYPAIALTHAGGQDWVVGSAFAASATAGMTGTTTALVSNRTNQTTVNGLDTNGGVTSFAAQTLAVTGSGNWITFTGELLASIVDEDFWTPSINYKSYDPTITVW